MEKQIIHQGPGVLGLLGVAFVILKLLGYINWSWWLVLLPFWGPAVIVLILSLIVGLILAIGIWKNTK